MYTTVAAWWGGVPGVVGVPGVMVVPGNVRGYWAPRGTGPGPSPHSPYPPSWILTSPTTLGTTSGTTFWTTLWPGVPEDPPRFQSKKVSKSVKKWSFSCPRSGGLVEKLTKLFSTPPGSSGKFPENHRKVNNSLFCAEVQWLSPEGLFAILLINLVFY